MGWTQALGKSFQPTRAWLQQSDRVFFKKWAIPGLFFFIFVLSMHLTENNKWMSDIKVCRWLNSNRRPPRKRPLYQRSHNHSPMLLHWQLLVKFCSILSNICLKRKTFLRIALFCPSEDFRPEYDRNVW